MLHVICYDEWDSNDNLRDSNNDMQFYNSSVTGKSSMITNCKPISFVLFGIIYLLGVKVTTGQQTNSPGINHCTIFRFSLIFISYEFILLNYEKNIILLNLRNKV